MVHQLVEATGIDLKNGVGIPELTRFREYKIVEYAGLNCDSVMFQGLVESDKRLNIFFDEVTQHYHVFAILRGAMAKRYICEACNKGCRCDVLHTCKQALATVWPVSLVYP